jgi:hypothetical protein
VADGRGEVPVDGLFGRSSDQVDGFVEENAQLGDRTAVE